MNVPVKVLAKQGRLVAIDSFPQNGYKISIKPGDVFHFVSSTSDHNGTTDKHSGSQGSSDGHSITSKSSKIHLNSGNTQAGRVISTSVVLFNTHGYSFAAMLDHHDSLPANPKLTPSSSNLDISFFDDHMEEPDANNAFYRSSDKHLHKLLIKEGQLRQYGLKSISCCENGDFNKSLISPLVHENNTTLKAVFRDQPRDMDRVIIKNGWHTGIAAIDLLAPVGVGQGMMILGDNKSRKEELVMNMLQGISHQVHGRGSNNTSVVYSLTSQTNSQIIKRKLGELALPAVFVEASNKSQSDMDPLHVLNSYTACSVAEEYRDSGRHSLLILDSLDAHMRVWRRAQKISEELYKRRHSDPPKWMFGAGADRAELRQFHSSIMQRAANLNSDKGSGSLTILSLFSTVGGSGGPKAGEGLVPYSLADFEADVVKKKRPQSDIARVKNLMDRKIPLTVDVLIKIGIKPPATRIALDPAKTNKQTHEFLMDKESEKDIMKQHYEELMSISDGQVVIDTTGKIDPKASFTRIGVGTNVNKLRDTRYPILQALAPGLRLEMINLFDATNVATDAKMLTLDPSLQWQRNRATAWKTALFNQKRDSLLRVTEEIIIVYSIQKGFFDDGKLIEKLLSCDDITGLPNIVLQYRKQSSQILNRIDPMKLALSQEEVHEIESFIKNLIKS